jgi:MYXO-CTERM domain-containing protein
MSLGASIARTAARWWTVLFGACVLLAAGTARANGRYPLADQIVIDPANADHLVARATFGLLGSDNAGQRFRWVCETAVGYFGVDDPPIAVTANGSVVVASSKGLSVSPDGGCMWIRNAGLTGTWFGVDVTVVPARPHEALAVLSNFQDGAYTVSVVKTVNDGASWDELVSTLGTSFLATTIEVAPSNPDRVYVSGKVLPGGTAAMMRSDDGARTFSPFPLDLTGAFSIFIGAVDPHDPDIVYLRTNADDIGRVLVSHDGAKSWNEIWQAPDDVSGFALSPDGATLAVGASSVGVSVASTSDFAFRRTSNVGVYCLTFWGQRLLVCTKEAIDGFSIGVSDDLGEHFDALLHLSDVLPRGCAFDASAAVCALDWENVAMAIGADAGARGASDAGAPTAPPSSDGCDCALGPAGVVPSNNAWALAVAGAIASVLRRRRTRV